MTVVKTDDVLGGDPRLEGRRISVLQVAEPVLAGHEPASVADQLGITLAEVHEALAYFYDNSDEMAAIRREYESLEDELGGRSNAPHEATR